MATRVSQHGLEVTRSEDAPLVRVSQAVVESVRIATAPNLRVSQFVVEVLRAGAPPATRQFPVKLAGRVTDNGGGTRVFPV